MKNSEGDNYNLFVTQSFIPVIPERSYIIWYDIACEIVRCCKEIEAHDCIVHHFVQKVIAHGHD